jgi:hypothetical protein
VRGQLAVAAALLAVAVGAGPAAADQGPVASRPVEVVLDRSAQESVLGDRVTVRSTVINTGAVPTGPLIAHLDVVSLHDDVYVDPEDWSADRSVDVPSMPAGGRTTLTWTVRNVAAGEFDVYVVMLPASPAPASAPLSVSLPTRLTVASRQTLDPGGSLGVVVAVPLSVGLLLLGTRLRRRGRQDSSPAGTTPRPSP